MSSIMVDNIRKLKLISDYSVLNLKICMMDELRVFDRELNGDKVKDFIANHNILYNNDENIDESEYLVVYASSEDEDNTKFRQSLYIVTYPEVTVLPEEKLLSEYDSVTLTYFDNLYKKLNNSLEKIKPEYENMFK